MKILFVGKKDCSYSLNAFEYLQKLGHNITVVWSEKRNQKFSQEILSWEGDYLFCFHSHIIVPKILLDRVKTSINFHPGSPDHPGSGMVNWALYNNSKEFGVTVHLIDDKIDHGNILRVKRFKILDGDNIESLIDRTKSYSISLFYDIIQEILIDHKTIDELLDESKNEKWNCESRKIDQVNKMSIVDINIDSDELDRRIKSFHSKQFPLSLYLHGRKFIHV